MGAIELFCERHTLKNDERLGLFQGLVERYAVGTALYPGSFVHVTPSFVIPTVVYCDSDRRGERFFSDPGVLELVQRRKEYVGDPVFRFHFGDFEHSIAEPEGSFDLLISQYAGFVSRACKAYLQVGGYLVANNSHGDASMAALDPDYDLVAVYRRRGERFTFAADCLDSYMVPKSGRRPSKVELQQSLRGPAFTRPVAGYVFRRSRQAAQGS